MAEGFLCEASWDSTNGEWLKLENQGGRLATDTKGRPLAPQGPSLARGRAAPGGRGLRQVSLDSHRGPSSTRRNGSLGYWGCPGWVLASFVLYCAQGPVLIASLLCLLKHLSPSFSPLTFFIPRYGNKGRQEEVCGEHTDTVPYILALCPALCIHMGAIFPVPWSILSFSRWDFLISPDV